MKVIFSEHEIQILNSLLQIGGGKQRGMAFLVARMFKIFKVHFEWDLGRDLLGEPPVA